MARLFWSTTPLYLDAEPRSFAGPANHATGLAPGCADVPTASILAVHCPAICDGLSDRFLLKRELASTIAHIYTLNCTQGKSVNKDANELLSGSKTWFAVTHQAYNEVCYGKFNTLQWRWCSTLNINKF